MRSGTDYVGVLDDQLRWDTTRATISCSLRYKLLYVSGLHLLAHLKLFVLGTSGLQMLYLSFSRIARRLCVCVCVYVLVHAGMGHGDGTCTTCSLSSLFVQLCHRNNKQKINFCTCSESTKKRNLPLFCISFFSFFLSWWEAMTESGENRRDWSVAYRPRNDSLSLPLMVFYWDSLF